MRVLSAIFLAAAMTGTAAGQVAKTVPPARQGPAVSVDTDISRPVTENFQSRITAAGETFKGLSKQIDGLRSQRALLAKQRAELVTQRASLDAGAKARTGDPRSESWKAQQAEYERQVQALTDRISTLDQQMAEAQSRIDRVMGELDKLEQALKADQAEMRRQIDQERKELQQAQKAQKADQSENMKIQQMMSQYNQAETLASNVHKKKEDPESSSIRKIN